MNVEDFIEKLFNNNYRRFEDHFNNAKNLYQKRVTDSAGTKYFIDVYHYDYRSYPDISKHKTDDFVFKGQFRRHKENKDQTVDVSFAADFLDNPYRELTTIQEVEKFFEGLFNKMNFDYYEN